MSDSDIEKQQRSNISSKTLVNLETSITQNITSNSNDLKQLSTEQVITSKEEQHIPRMINNDKQKSSSNTTLSDIPSLLSFSALSSNSINEELIAQVHNIISSWNNHVIQNSETNIPTHPHIQESQSIISSDSLDCCNSNQSDSSDYWDSFHTTVKLRSTMINISKRLTNLQSLSIVDTHCHFDLIFDRLYIKHNNVKKYFDDYKDFYPAGLSFELAIQVFWRPKHLSKKNWINWYSKYLNDERVYGSCGIHPHWSSLWTEKTIEDIERCLQHPKIVAIGEIGLDFGPKNTCNIDQQCQVFKEQLKLAVKWAKPIVIHSRGAYQQTFDIMKEYLQPNHKIHLHCFVGTIDDVHLFTSYFNEIKFGFTPIITRSNSFHTVIQQLDLKQILSETDAPYFVPEELSNLSRSGHPGMVYSVIEIIAQLRQISIHDVACQLKENASNIYGI